MMHEIETQWMGKMQFYALVNERSIIVTDSICKPGLVGCC